jgi:hypothetical protein
MTQSTERTSLQIVRAQELRRQAAQCRRAARVPTSGAGDIDRALVALAEQFEREATALERQLQGGTSD